MALTRARRAYSVALSGNPADVGRHMRILTALACAATLCTAAPATAQVVDMNTVACGGFMQLDDNTRFAVVMWLDAYYRDEDDPPIINFDKMGQKYGKLQAYCRQNPTHALTTAAEPIMSE
jgi:acid stress chaperone HdeB